VDDARISGAQSGQVSVESYTYAPVAGKQVPVVLTGGRMPSAADEIVLAPTVASEMHAATGSVVRLAGAAGPRALTVTGIGFVPSGPHNNYDDGAWLTPAGFDRLFRGAHFAFKFHLATVALRPGADGPGGRQRTGRLARSPRGAAANRQDPAHRVRPSALRSGPMATIRVALAEDNLLLREGVSRLVAANQDFELVGTASDLPELLALIERCEPDVVITDIRMPPTGRDEGIQAAAWLREHRPGVGVVVLSQYTAPGYAVALLERGSAGRAYLLKERIASVDDLVRAIRAVASGGSVIDPLVVDELVRSRSHPGASSLDTLTARETQILAEMAQGKNNAAIAAAVSVSERAVEKHTNSIFAKLGLSEEKDVNRRVMAVLLFLGRGQGS